MSEPVIDDVEDTQAENTGRARDKETRAIFREIAARKREPMWKLMERLAVQELAKLADKPRKVVTK